MQLIQLHKLDLAGVIYKHLPNHLPRHYHDNSKMLARELVRKLTSLVISFLTTLNSLVPRSPLHGLDMRLYTLDYTFLVCQHCKKQQVRQKEGYW